MIKKFGDLNEKVDYQGQWTVGRLKKFIEDCPDDMLVASVDSNGDYSVASFFKDDGSDRDEEALSFWDGIKRLGVDTDGIY